MIRNTFERINDGILDSINFTLYEEPLFKIINLPLWRQSDGDLKPAEVWTEALEVVARLRKTRERYRHLEIGRISDNLKKRYTIIDSKERGTDEAQHSMMLVMATVMFMLSMAGGTSTNPHQKIIASIVMMVNDVDGFNELCQDVKKEERMAVSDSELLPVKDVMSEKMDTEDSLAAFTGEDIARQCEFNHTNPKAVLQAMYAIKPEITNLNDWIAVYAVLLERKIIKNTMTKFCNIIKQVFNIELDNKYMSKVLQNHGERMTQWSPKYTDQERHLRIAREFKQILDEYQN